jgi:hypothetical protein
MLVLKSEHIKQFGHEVIRYTSKVMIDDKFIRTPPYIARNDYYCEEDKIIVGEKFNWFVKKK